MTDTILVLLLSSLDYGNEPEVHLFASKDAMFVWADQNMNMDMADLVRKAHTSGVSMCLQGDTVQVFYREIQQ